MLKENSSLRKHTGIAAAIFAVNTFQAPREVAYLGQPASLPSRERSASTTKAGDAQEIGNLDTGPLVLAESLQVGNDGSRAHTADRNRPFLFAKRHPAGRQNGVVCRQTWFLSCVPYDRIS